MKTLLTTILSLVACAAFAGGELITAPIPPAPEVYGHGFYISLDGGGNVYQDVQGKKPAFIVNEDPNVVGFGGIKVGYTFGTGLVRFAVEEDAFYNGISTTVSLVNQSGKEVAHSNPLAASGQFLTNVKVKLALGKLQPYIGLGGGAYVLAHNDTNFTLNHNQASNGWAAAAIAGADFYFSPKVSTFIEYKFLDDFSIKYQNNHNLGQHLVGAGLSLHF